MDVGGWLQKLGLGKYAPAFIENAIDSDVLPELTEGDLEKLGIPLGDRKRLIKAIRARLAALLIRSPRAERGMRRATTPARRLPSAVTSP